MRASSPVPASPTARLVRRLAAARSWWRALSPLGRDIVVILIAKTIALTLIWLAFFREPAAPHMSMDPQRVESRLIAPSPMMGPQRAPSQPLAPAPTPEPARAFR